MHDRAGIYDERELFERDHTGVAIDLNARHTGGPRRHIAFLAERGCDPDTRVLGQRRAPTDFLGRTLDHVRLTSGAPN